MMLPEVSYMTTFEHELIEKIGQLDEAKQRQVMDFVRSLEAESRQHYYSARELLKLPPAERDRLVAEALAKAADEDFEVFEAYSEEALDE
jgi:hypothetical protein